MRLDVDGRSAWQKIERARQHIQELDRVCETFRKSDCYGIRTECDSQTAQTSYKIARLGTPPVDIALIAGDALSNLRSALDHLAYCLVLRNTCAVPTDKVYFPIKDSAAIYHSAKAQREMHGMGHAAIKAIDAIKPYKGGNDTLWFLKELNNRDKHRLLVTVASVNIAHTETAADRKQARENWAREHPDESFPFPDNVLRFVESKNPRKILKAGDELLTVLDTKMHQQPTFMVQVAFGESGVAEGEMLVPLLSKMTQEIIAIICQFNMDPI
jgi:hypothetical protein